MITRRWLMDEWRDEFLMQLRLRDVPGDRCGDALAEIDAHCTDSGQSPEEAFGDPVRYAELRATSFTRGRTAQWRATPGRAVLASITTVGGVIALLQGVTCVANDRPGVFTVGQLVSVSAAPLFALGHVAFTRPGRPLRFGLLSVLIGVGTATMMLPQLIWKDVLVETSNWALLVGGLLLLTLAWWPSSADSVFEDRVVDPRTGSEPFRNPAAALAVARFVLRFGLPIILLGVVLIVLLIPDPR